MAEADVPERTLTCDGVEIGIAMVRDQLKVFTEFFLDNAKEHEGILSACSHNTEDAVNTVSELIDTLEMFKGLIKTHTHVTTRDNIIRETPGRRRKAVEPKPSSALRDSGVSITYSGDARSNYLGNSDLDIAGAGHQDTCIRSQCSTCDHNMDQQENIKCVSKQVARKLGIKDDKNQQHTEDYSDVNKKNQTLPKTRYDPNANTSCEDDSRKNKDDNWKCGDS